MQIIPISNSNSLAMAVGALSRGELVIYPTETCYGLGIDATNSDAVSKLLLYKGDRHRQIAIAVNNKEMADKFVIINEIANNLYTKFLPGPITVISESKHNVDERLESVDGTIGIRVPDYTYTLNLIKTFGKPITATSANTSGKKEPYSLKDWQKYTLQDKQDMVAIFLDAGPLVNRPTSTVVDTTLNNPQVLRQGQLTIPELSTTYMSHSMDETLSLAKTIIQKYLSLTRNYPLILALQGNLGTGKTHFIKGIAEYLKIDATVSSPTFTILKEYPYSLSKYSGILYHLDTWRLADQSELESTLHLSVLLKPGNIIAIEWAGKAKNILKDYEKEVPILVINIDDLGGNTRKITYAFSTPEWS